MNQIGFQQSHIEAYKNGIPLINKDEFVTYKKGKRGRIYKTTTIRNHPLEKQVHFAKYNRLFRIPSLERPCKRMPVFSAQNHIDSIELYKKRKTKKRKPKKNKRKTL